MKVALISNWDIQCGNAEYARDLLEQLEKDKSINVRCFPGRFDEESRKHIIGFQPDVAIVNWHPGRVDADVKWLKPQGTKILLIWQESTDMMAAGDDWDMVVSHEKPALGQGKNFRVIPHGIPKTQITTTLDGNLRVGTAGFPFPWKRPDLVAEIAKRYGMKFRFIAPKSDQMNTDDFVAGIKGHIDGLMELHRSWLPKEQVVNLLSDCTFNVFWFESHDPSDTLGQSGSVRLGLAAGRPTIISRHRKLKTLFPYEDELYICDTEADVWKAVDQILEGPALAKKPKRILQDMSWDRTGAMYRELLCKL